MDAETEGGAVRDTKFDPPPADEAYQSHDLTPQKELSANQIQGQTGQNSANNSDSGIDVEIGSNDYTAARIDENRRHPQPTEYKPNLQNASPRDNDQNQYNDPVINEKYKSPRSNNYNDGGRRSRKTDRTPRPETKQSMHRENEEGSHHRRNSRSKSRGQSYDPNQHDYRAKSRGQNYDHNQHGSRAKSRGHSYDPEYRQPVHIYAERLDFKRNAKSRIGSLDNLSYQGPEQPHFKVFTEKVDFRSNAQSKLDTHSSLSYRSQRPLVMIYNEKLNFGKKAKPKISSFENIHYHGSRHEVRIVNDPVKITAKPKVNSFQNVGYSPRKIDYHVVNHRTDWFTPGKTSSKKDDISFYPSINNANPIPLRTNKKQRKTQFIANNNNECCEQAEEVFGTYYLTPRSKIRREKPKGYYMEPVQNNKKVHFVQNDELADYHRKRFEEQTRNTRQQFQAIREESSQNSGTMTPRDLKTRHGMNRPMVAASTDPFRQYNNEVNELSEENHPLTDESDQRMNKREILPRINPSSDRNHELRENEEESYSPQVTHREPQPELKERTYDAIEEKRAAPLPETDSSEIQEPPKVKAEPESKTDNSEQIGDHKMSPREISGLAGTDSKDEKVNPEPHDNTGYRDGCENIENADPEEFLKQQLLLMQDEINLPQKDTKNDSIQASRASPELDQNSLQSEKGIIDDKPQLTHDNKNEILAAEQVMNGQQKDLEEETESGKVELPITTEPQSDNYEQVNAIDNRDSGIDDQDQSDEGLFKDSNEFNENNNITEIEDQRSEKIRSKTYAANLHYTSENLDSKDVRKSKTDLPQAADEETPNKEPTNSTSHFESKKDSQNSSQTLIERVNLSEKTKKGDLHQQTAT